MCLGSVGWLVGCCVDVFYFISFYFFFACRVRTCRKVKALYILHPEERLNRSQIHLNRKEFSTRILLYVVTCMELVPLLAISHPHFFLSLYFLFSDDAILFITSRVVRTRLNALYCRGAFVKILFFSIALRQQQRQQQQQ